jgi:hypothetical protein
MGENVTTYYVSVINIQNIWRTKSWKNSMNQWPMNWTDNSELNIANKQDKFEKTIQHT